MPPSWSVEGWCAHSPERCRSTRDPWSGAVIAPDSAILIPLNDGFPCVRPQPRAIVMAMGKSSADTTVVIDDTDKALIEALQRDGRMPYTKLAERVGLSEAAVRQRVQRLIESGVTQIVAVTDPMTLGFRRIAMIGLNVEGDTRAIADAIAKIADVDYVVLVSGSFDILVEVVCEDDDHLLKLLNDEIRAISGVRSTESFTYLRLYKQTYAWGTR